MKNLEKYILDLKENDPKGQQNQMQVDGIHHILI